MICYHELLLKLKSDLKLMAEANFNIFRTSINWARIYPTGEEETPNQKGLDFYHDMFKYCHELGMKVMVTILILERKYRL